MTHQSPPEARQSVDKPAMYPNIPGVRKGAPSTSQEAADQLAPHLGRLQKLAYEAIHAAGLDGLTGDELAERIGLERFAVRPRTSELRELGRIVDSGMRRRNAASGRRAAVWIASEFLPDPMTGAA